MNSLSWLIYLADISGNIKMVSWLGLFATFFIVVASFTLVQIVSDPHYKNDKDYERDIKATKSASTKLLWISLPIFLISLTFVNVIPTRQTIMLIAASEVGEQVLDTEVAGEAGSIALDSLKLLRQYINEQLEISNVPSDSQVVE